MLKRTAFLFSLVISVLRASLASADEPLADGSAAADAGAGVYVVQEPIASAPEDQAAPPDVSPEEWWLAVRAAERRQAEIRRLRAVMAKEGDGFSQERYEQHRRRRAGGTGLITVGALSMITGFALTVASTLVAPSDYYGDDPELVEQGYYNDYQYQKHEKSKRLLIGGLSALIGGGVMLGVGITLAVMGRSGMRRQELLRRKDEILGATARGRLTLQLVADPQQELVALRLRVAL
jgi:hypothetical protein